METKNITIYKYAVFLFPHDMQSIYCSIQQGSIEVKLVLFRPKIAVLRKNQIKVCFPFLSLHT